MDIFDQKEVLKTFSVCVDSREQDTAKARRRYEGFNAPYGRATIDYGDYTYNAVLPGGNAVYDAQKRISPAVSIERKESLDELAQCLTRGRERFEREFKRAMEHRAKMYLICEGGSWEHIIAGRYRTKVAPAAFFNSLTAYMARYGLTVLFCKEDTSGRLISEILYRELKERLEQGEYG